MKLHCDYYFFHDSVLVIQRFYFGGVKSWASMDDALALMEGCLVWQLAGMVELLAIIVEL